MIFSIVVTIVALSIMICLHELGHMLAAKGFGVLVREYSIGMGPKLFSVKPGETAYSLRLFPIGGFVQMEGETGDEDGAEPSPRSFKLLKPWKKLIVLAAGAVLNIVLGLVMFVIIHANTYVWPPIVTDISPQFTQTTVFRAGDEVVKIGKTPVHSRDDVVMELNSGDYSQGDLALVTVLRDGRRTELSAVLGAIEGRIVLGVDFGDVRFDPGPVQSLEYACYDTVYVVKAVIGALGKLISGRQSVDSLSGPVEIVTVVDQVAQTGSPDVWIELLWLFAMISVNLGVFNLLPIPALDGGQILFVLIEKITGREIKPSVAGTVNAVFFALLMLLAVYVTAGDIAGLVK